MFAWLAFEILVVNRDSSTGDEGSPAGLLFVFAILGASMLTHGFAAAGSYLVATSPRRRSPLPAWAVLGIVTAVLLALQTALALPFYLGRASALRGAFHNGTTSATSGRWSEALVSRTSEFTIPKLVGTHT